MLYDAGLILSVAIGGWLALDVAMADGWRRRSISIALLGTFSALWAGSELLLRAADAPSELALGRRLLYLGVLGATFSWYWVAVEADAPAWFRRGRWRVGLPLVPLLAIHSLLYVGPDGIVISLHSSEPEHGPLWIVAAMISWALISLGLCHYARAALRLRRRSPARTLAIAVAVGLPLVLNIGYAAGWFPEDPAACMLGPAGLLIRIGLVDTGLAMFLPLARSDILEQLDVGVVVAGIDDRVIDANAAAERLAGADELRGSRLDELSRNLAPTVEVLRFPLESHFSHTGTAVVLTDRRDAIEAERRLQLASRLEAVGSLTAGIAHEVNNPLAYISANLNDVEKLIAELEQPSAQAVLSEVLKQRRQDAAESLADAQEGIHRISLLVARLKGFARQPHPSEAASPIDLVEVTRRAVSMAGVGLPDGAIEIHASAPVVARGSDDAVVQIVVNLVLNAIQASGEEPRVEVEIEAAGADAIVRVADRGHGLDPDALDRIFDPFFTTKQTGTGLGLSISFDLARRMNGRIEAANRPGGGALFSLLLPSARSASA